MVNVSCVSYDFQVSGLQAGQTYRLRVLAVNEAGVGGPSLPTEPVTAQTHPGCLPRLQRDTNKKSPLRLLDIKYGIFFFILSTITHADQYDSKKIVWTFRHLQHI